MMYHVSYMIHHVMYHIYDESYHVSNIRCIISCIIYTMYHIMHHLISYMILYHMIWYFIRYDMIWYHIMSYNIKWYIIYVKKNHIRHDKPYDIIYQLNAYDIISRHISYHMPCHLMPYHIKYHTIYHVLYHILYHILYHNIHHIIVTNNDQTGGGQLWLEWISKHALNHRIAMIIALPTVVRCILTCANSIGATDQISENSVNKLHSPLSTCRNPLQYRVNIFSQYLAIVGHIS